MLKYFTFEHNFLLEDPSRAILCSKVPKSSASALQKKKSYANRKKTLQKEKSYASRVTILSRVGFCSRRSLCSNISLFSIISSGRSFQSILMLKSTKIFCQCTPEGKVLCQQKKNAPEAKSLMPAKKRTLFILKFSHKALTVKNLLQQRSRSKIRCLEFSHKALTVKNLLEQRSRSKIWCLQ